MKYLQKSKNSIQTELIKPKQEILPKEVFNKALQVRKSEESNLEITAVKKSNSLNAGVYWVVFFAVSAISAICYAFLTSKPAEPQVVKREIHRIYEKIKINTRAPAATKSFSGNYFEKSEVRNKIHHRYSILRQNLYNELSNLRDEGYRKDLNFYSSQASLDLDSYYDRKHLMLRGQKSIELCEKIGEDCNYAQEYLEFKKNNPNL